MIKRILNVGILAAMLAARCVAADAMPAPAPVPASGKPVIVKEWAADVVKRWKSDEAFGTLRPSAAGVVLTTIDKPDAVYKLQAQLLNATPIKAGDTMLIRFAARSLKAEAATGATRLKVGVGKSSPPWTNAASSELGLTADWQRFDIPFACPLDFPVGDAQFTFVFGYTPQQVELADVSLLNFGKSVKPDALPKTERFATPLPPGVLDREVKRVASMRAELDAVKDPSPTHGRTLHVAVDGKPSGNGDAVRPFATIPQALAAVTPGDTILVGAGEYREPKGISIKTSGTPDAWIKLKAAPGARPKILTSNWSGIELRGSIAYVEIDGFELQFVKDPSLDVHGSGIAPMYGTHHIRILNNVIHDYGTGGIISLDCDYLHLEGNAVYKNAHTSPYGGSGISLCRAFDFDDAPGYHNVIRRNVCFDNENKVIVLVTSGGTGHTLTDGNGIIIDVFKRSRVDYLKPHGEDRNGPTTPYRGRTLVEDNVCYDNGGRGIHVFRSERVDVINNTCYQNQRTPEINGGEFTAIESDDVVIANNIGVSRPGKRVSGQDGSTGLVVWTHNLLFGDDALRHPDGLFDVDPLFVKPPTTFAPGAPDAERLRLTSQSPAIGKGIAAIAPPVDFAGAVRADGSPVDLGAFQGQR